MTAVMCIKKALRVPFSCHTAKFNVVSFLIVVTEGQAYLVWPLGKVKCFDTLYPFLEWNV